MKHLIHNAVLFFSCLLFFASTSTFSQSWNSLGSGTNGTVSASIVFNGQLIVAGSFTTAGGMSRNRIASWNGTTWNALGTGTNGTIHALTIYNSQLIAGGFFTNAGGTQVSNIASWNGTSWNTLGLGVNDTVFALTVYGGSLRAGGSFITAGGINCNRIAFWNGTSWSPMPTVGANGTNNTVYAFTLFGADLIIGGAFTMVGNNIAANRVVRYNSGGSGSFITMGTGVDNNAVFALAPVGALLYVGGNFSTIGGVTVNNIGRWTGSSWNTVSTGTTGPVKSFVSNGAILIVGGTFTNAGTIINVNNIASWNGTAFSALSTGITGGTPSVNSLTIWSNVLFAAGNFTNAGVSPIPANNVARFGTAPTAPNLLLPLDGATGVPVTPTLDWTDVPGSSSYGVQVSTNPNFTSFVFNLSNLGASQFIVTPALVNNTTYFWRANATNGFATGPFSLARFFTTGTVGIINNGEIPLKFNLYQNYPNPFNPVTKIRFDLPANADNNSQLILRVYDINGKVVTELLNTPYIAGEWEVDFDASNYSSGVYFYKIEAGKYNSLNKMVLIK